MPHPREDCQGVLRSPLQWIYKLTESVHIRHIYDTLHPRQGTAGNHERVTCHIGYTLQTEVGSLPLFWEALVLVFDLFLCHSHSFL